MEIPFYLAMTAAECSGCAELPSHIGWLACHFSSSGPGLSNMPKTLPKNSLLILDDSIPFCNHQPELICRQLGEAISAFSVKAVILDFQRPGHPQMQALTEALQRELPCNVVVTPEYAGHHFPLFLPPCPLHRPLAAHLAPHKGREIWLDISPFPAQVTLTTDGSIYTPLCHMSIGDMPHWDAQLCCHYRIEIQEKTVQFSLSRDIERWLTDVEAVGIQAAIGLYQEWK